MNVELNLLRSYHEHADAFAFRELVAAHAGMVFATARRVTRDAALAEDVTQETFIELARNSHRVTESVGAWLHRVAWRRACNAIRDEMTRRRYEEAAAQSLHERPEATWEELEPQIDEALIDLPNKLREPLVEHFLEGRTQQEVAARLGVSQATVSRLLDSGIGELRSRLRSKGMLCGAGFALLLTANSAQAVPPTLTEALGKLAVSGIGSATTDAITAPAWKTALAWTLRPTALLVLLLTAFTLVIFQSRTAAPLGPTSPPPASWRGRAFCPTCALLFTENRQPQQGIFIHNEGGRDVIYDLQLPQPVPDFHQRICSESMNNREAIAITGKSEKRENLSWLLLENLEVAPK